MLYRIILILAVATPAFADKTNLPTPVEQQEAAALVKEVYGDEYNEAKTDKDKQALAVEVLNAAMQSTKPANRYALLRLARNIATGVGDGRTALQAIDEIDKTFQVNALELKKDALIALVTKARFSADHKGIAEVAVALVDQAILQDDYSIGNVLVEIALSEARKAKDGELVKAIAAKKKELTEVTEAYAKVVVAEKTLEDKPMDPDANLVVGKFHCFVKGDWDKGLPMLVLGNDPVLKAIAVKEIGEVSKPEEQVALGDAWWDLTEKEAKAKDRAAYWYQRALPGLTGLVKGKVAKRLKEFSGESVDLVKLIDPAKDALAGEWKHYQGGIALVNPQGKPRLAIPVHIEGNYDLRIVFTRYEGEGDVMPILCMGSSTFPIFLSAGDRTEGKKVSGIVVRNRPPSADFSASAFRPGNLVNGRRYTLDIQIRTNGDIGSIETFLDRKPFVKWSGKVSDLMMLTDWKIGETASLGLGAYNRIIFHQITLTLVGGTMRKPKEKAEAPGQYAMYQGAWDIEYNHKDRNHRQYFIDQNGVVNNISREATLKTTKDGVILDFEDGDGRVERLSMKQGRLYVEHFNASDFPGGKPRHLGVGTKLVDTRKPE